MISKNVASPYQSTNSSLKMWNAWNLMCLLSISLLIFVLFFLIRLFLIYSFTWTHFSCPFMLVFCSYRFYEWCDYVFIYSQYYTVCWSLNADHLMSHCALKGFNFPLWTWKSRFLVWNYFSFEFSSTRLCYRDIFWVLLFKYRQNTRAEIFTNLNLLSLANKLWQAF